MKTLYIKYSLEQPQGLFPQVGHLSAQHLPPSLEMSTPSKARLDPQHKEKEGQFHTGQSHGLFRHSGAKKKELHRPPKPSDKNLREEYYLPDLR